MYWSSTAFSVVAYASQRTLSQLWRTATVRCCHKRTYVFLLNSNPNQSVSPDTSRNRKFKIIKKSLWWESYCTIRTDVRSLMVTLRSFFFAKARKVRILVTGKVCSCYGVTLLLSCLFIYLFLYLCKTTNGLRGKMLRLSRLWQWRMLSINGARVVYYSKCSISCPNKPCAHVITFPWYVPLIYCASAYSISTCVVQRTTQRARILQC